MWGTGDGSTCSTAKMMSAASAYVVDSKVTIFPNPVDDMITIKSDALIIQAPITDALGINYLVKKSN